MKVWVRTPDFLSATFESSSSGGVAVIELDAVYGTKRWSSAAVCESAMEDDERVVSAQNIELVTVPLIMTRDSGKCVWRDTLAWPPVGNEMLRNPIVAVEDWNALTINGDKNSASRRGVGAAHVESDEPINLGTVE